MLFICFDINLVSARGRNVGANKVLDVARGEHDDGTDVILWTEKESSLVEGERLTW